MRTELPAASGPQPSSTRLASILTNPNDPAFMPLQLASIALVLVSVGALVAESVAGVTEEYASLLYALEWVFLIGFGLEYLAHLYVAADRWRHARSFFGVIDLLATLPSLLIVLGIGLAGGPVRILRVLRVLRTLKIIRLAGVRLKQSGAVAGQRRNTLSLDLQIYGMAIFVALILSATLMYEAEGHLEDSMFVDIPTSLWWAVSLLATHGAAFSATTVLGKVLSGLTMLTGVALFSILTNVIGRSLLTTLFGDSSDDSAAAPQQRPAKVEAAAAAVRSAGAAVSVAVTRAVGSAGPLPSPDAVEPPERLRLGWRRFLYDAYHDTRSDAYAWVTKVVTTSIVISVACVMLESVAAIQEEYGAAMFVIELAVSLVFILDYAAQVYVADDRRAYVTSFWGIIDLVAVLPAVFPIVGLTQVKTVRLFRILRVLRVLKLLKSATVRARASSQAKTSTLAIDLEIFAIALVTAMIMSASLMWFAEGEMETASSAPDAFEGLWFAVVTLTTTGSGVNVPQTVLGRVVAGSTMIVGLALFGILTSVIGRTMLKSLFGDDGGTDGDVSTVDDADGGEGGRTPATASA